MRIARWHDRLPCVAVCALFVAACGGGSEPGGTTGPASGLLVVAGDAQAAVVGNELGTAVVARLVDDAGAAVGGEVVNFRVTAGGGTVFAGATSTDADGLARERWTLGTTAGPQLLEARAISGARLMTATFTAIATPDAPAGITILSGSGQTSPQFAQLGTPVVAHVADRYGNSTPGVLVSFTPGASCGQASPPAATTDPSGNASTAWTLGRLVGGQTLSIAIPQVGPVTALATATALPPQAALALVSGGNQSGVVGTALPDRVVAQLNDLHGRPVVGQPVSFRTTAAGAQLDAPSATTDADGLVSVAWQLGTVASPQQLQVDASDPLTGKPVPTLTVTAGARPGPAAVVSAVSGDGQTTEQGFFLPSKVFARVADAFGNPVAGVDVSFTPATDCGWVSPPTTITGADGKAGTAWRLGTLLGDETLQASAPGVPPLTFHATATLAGPFDGYYQATMTSGCCASIGAFTVMSSKIVSAGMLWGSTTAGADGKLTFQITSGRGAAQWYSGQFVAGASGVTATGTCVIPDAMPEFCNSGTWTAAQQ